MLLLPLLLVRPAPPHVSAPRTPRPCPRSFVLEPNQHDEAFLRVGRFLQEAKTRRGLS